MALEKLCRIECIQVRTRFSGVRFRSVESGKRLTGKSYWFADQDEEENVLVAATDKEPLGFRWNRQASFGGGKVEEMAEVEPRRRERPEER